jgi:TM2 domain-containing membrane protein YozV
MAKKESFRRYPVIAALLSFIWAGFGQLYNGQIGKGIGFIVASFVLNILVVAFIPVFFIGLLFFLPVWLIFWIYNIFDAYFTAKRLNEKQELEAQ